MKGPVQRTGSHTSMSGCGKLAAVRLVSYRDPEGVERVGEVEDDRVHELAAPSMIAWLGGEGRERSGAERGLDELTLLAPVPEPPSLRDFIAYEGHVATGFRLRGSQVPEHWYKAPAFYFSNPASIRGPGEAVKRPGGCNMLDLELEIAAVIGAGGEIAGFTLMNDWSARDFQLPEMTVGLGPAKAKDFATSLGPWIATPDELPYADGRLNLVGSVSVNGTELSLCHADEQHFTWPEMVAHAARDTRLRPGDVLGSGTLTGGCLVELGPLDGERFLEPGDVVALEAPGLGRLESTVE
jgi:fumarylacetoacetate (FAA) hydrolase